MAIRRFEEIESWQDARERTQGIFALRNNKSPQERHGALWEQLTRAALSAMPNIAEGFDRPSDADFARLFGIAQGSILEVQSHLYIALDLGYLTLDPFAGLYRQSCRVSRKIGGLDPIPAAPPKTTALGDFRRTGHRPTTMDQRPTTGHRPPASDRPRKAAGASTGGARPEAWGSRSSRASAPSARTKQKAWPSSFACRWNCSCNYSRPASFGISSPVRCGRC